MITALWILVGLQLVQTVAIVVLFCFEILRYKAQKRTDIKNNEVVMHILESRPARRHGQNPWILYGPGSTNHPASKKSLDRFKTCLGALEYCDAIYPGVRVEITDVHFDIIPTQDVRNGTRIEVS